MFGSYLPFVDGKDLQQTICGHDWNGLSALINNCEYERLGLDRSFIIQSDIANRFGDRPLKILDMGCNNGLISLVMALFGHDVTGIDSGIINSQGKYEKLQFINANLDNLHLITGSIEDFFCSDKTRWECIILLSVLHQFENGYAYNKALSYGQEQISTMINQIFDRANEVVYYECPYEEPGFEFHYGLNLLEKNLYDFDKYRIHELAKTIGPNGVIRQLYAIERRA